MRPRTSLYVLPNTCFNPRICKRCDKSQIEEMSFTESFNPRICKRCDLPLISSKFNPMVSIHASVKDATSFCYGIPGFRHVSIHASVKDATRPGKESDIGHHVSIHASVKDATFKPLQPQYITCVSIHASVKDATQHINPSL